MFTYVIYQTISLSKHGLVSYTIDYGRWIHHPGFDCASFCYSLFRVGSLKFFAEYKV